MLTEYGPRRAPAVPVEVLKATAGAGETHLLEQSVRLEWSTRLAGRSSIADSDR